jgi:hypothetical protein
MMYNLNPVYDLSKYKTAAGVAKALHKALVEIASVEGRSWMAEHIHLRTPKDTDLVMDEYCEGRWHISWEGGPYEWAINILDGIYTAEVGAPLGPRFVFPAGFYPEAATHFTVSIQEG